MFSQFFIVVMPGIKTHIFCKLYYGSSKKILKGKRGKRGIKGNKGDPGLSIVGPKGEPGHPGLLPYHLLHPGTYMLN